MTETVVAIEADRPVSEALDCFFQYSIHHLPVVREGRLIGMLSAADVMKLRFFAPQGTADRSSYLDERLSIERLMGSPTVALSANTSISEASERLIGAGVHAAPVVDEVDRLIGIVTTTDIMRSLLRGAPRRGTVPPPRDEQPAPGGEEPRYHRKPTDEEYATALQTARLLHVEARDPRHLGKAMLYLDQRRALLERVLELADHFLLSGQDVQAHAVLLKAIYAAKRAEEHATGEARVPFPLQ